MATPIAIVAYLALFVVAGVLFLFGNLLLGRFARPSNPNEEKLEIYECGEPTIGSSFVQFDLRFYVVALLFLIFDVEIAFFFPWATVFGKANHLADARLHNPAAYATPDDRDATVAALYRELGVSDAGYQATLARSQAQFALADADQDGRLTQEELIQKVARDAADEAAGEGLSEEAAAALVESKKRTGQRLFARLDGAVGGAADGKLTAEEFSHGMMQVRGRELAVWTLADIAVFFAVLLVGFAYVWKRGDLDWVRATSAQGDAAVAPGPPPAEVHQPVLSA